MIRLDTDGTMAPGPSSFKNKPAMVIQGSPEVLRKGIEGSPEMSAKGSSSLVHRARELGSQHIPEHPNLNQDDGRMFLACRSSFTTLRTAGCTGSDTLVAPLGPPEHVACPRGTPSALSGPRVEQSSR